MTKQAPRIIVPKDEERLALLKHIYYPDIVPAQEKFRYEVYRVLL